MWKVTSTARFDEQFKALQKDYPRIKDAVDGVRWILERDPEQTQLLFKDMGGPGVNGHGVKLDEWPEVPAAIIYFTINGDTVTMYAIRGTVAGPDSVVM